jgi:hypothetical protein
MLPRREGGGGGGCAMHVEGKGGYREGRGVWAG